MRSIVGIIFRQIPVLSAFSNLAETSAKVYNCTSPGKAIAIAIAVTDVAINCTPPGVKYPLLCAALAECCAATYVSGGNPLAVTETTCMTELIVKTTFGE